MIYRARTGAPWRDLPADLGAWQTVHRRFQAWSSDSTFDRVLAELLADADAAGEVEWAVSVDSTIARAHQHATCAARSNSQPSSHTGALSNDKNPLVGREEPDDHGIGRSRGGLSTKAHALVDGKRRLLTLIVGPGHAGDSPVLPLLLGELRVTRRGRGRPRTRPEALCADKAYCSRGHRALLRSRGIKAVIPEKSDQAVAPKTSRQRRRPTDHARLHRLQEPQRRRTILQPHEALRGLASRYDKYALVYRGGIILAAIVDWLKHI